MPRLIGGPEKAHDADVTIAAHAMSITLLIKKMSWSSQKLSTRKFNQHI